MSAHYFHDTPHIGLKALSQAQAVSSLSVHLIHASSKLVSYLLFIWAKMKYNLMILCSEHHLLDLLIKYSAIVID